MNNPAAGYFAGIFLVVLVALLVATALACAVAFAYPSRVAVVFAGGIVVLCAGCALAGAAWGLPGPVAGVLAAPGIPALLAAVLCDRVVARRERTP